MLGPPCPDSTVFYSQVCINGIPEYYVERKLGKGGFGQVYVGRRCQSSKQKDGPQANYVGFHACMRTPVQHKLQHDRFCSGRPVSNAPIPTGLCRSH